MAIIRLLDYMSILAWNMLLLCPLLKFDLKLPERRLITTMAQPHEINASGTQFLLLVYLITILNATDCIVRCL